MQRTTVFLIRAMLAGGTVLLLLALGMAFTILRFERISSTQIARVRAEERSITIVERLRWTSELVVSFGRGYFLTGDTALLSRLHDAEAQFDRNMLELRRATTANPADDRLMAEVDAAEKEFASLQQRYLRADGRLDADAYSRFDRELLPNRRRSRELMNRLVEVEDNELHGIYQRAQAERMHVARRLYTLLGGLALTSIAITWLFAKRLARAYRSEHDALRTAQAALVTRDELMGMVAHDLRNPLAAIKMKAALLRRSDALETTRAQAESIEHITGRMEHLIRSMLDAATIEAGRFTISKATFSADEIVQEALELFENLSASKQIHLERAAGEAGLVVFADRERALQVMSNLLGNALKFTPQGGHVTVSAERHDDSVLFSVSDTGPGVASHDIAHVFERYWKHEARGQKGTGLGLFIAKGIIDAHGGRIWVECEPGCGATFRFSLPTAESARAAAARDPLCAPAGADLRHDAGSQR